MSTNKDEKSSLVNYAFSHFEWNDFEQKNYILYTCGNSDNTGGVATDFLFERDPHGENTYSCWHQNEGMKYRCWGNSEKMAKCPMVKAK